MDISSKLELIQINLDQQPAIFAPGSVISGRVILNLNKTKRFRALKLRFIGKCHVEWATSGSRRETGEELYFHDTIFLYGSADAASTDMPSGHYTYPFNYILRKNIPSSFVHKLGWVEYIVKAIIDRPWKLDHETKMEFQVEAPVELNNPTYELRAIDDEVKQNYYGCFIMPCMKVGSAILRIRIPKSGFACGDSVEVMIDIDNQSHTVEVTKLQLSLKQKLQFHATKPRNTKKQTNRILLIKHMGPFPKIYSTKLISKIPFVPLSYLEWCNLIDIDYQIIVSIDVSGCHLGTTKKYNIVIGTRPVTVFQDIFTADYSQNTILPNTISSEPIDYYNSASAMSVSQAHFSAS